MRQKTNKTIDFFRNKEGIPFFRVDRNVNWTCVKIGGRYIYFSKVLMRKRPAPEGMKHQRRALKNWLVIDRNSRCEICGETYPYEMLQVHHIKPRWKHPELEFEKSNLMCLCQGCHQNIHLLTSKAVTAARMADGEEE